MFDAAQRLQQDLETRYGLSVPIVYVAYPPPEHGPYFQLHAEEERWGDPWGGYYSRDRLTLERFILPGTSTPVTLSIRSINHDLSGQTDEWSAEATGVPETEASFFREILDPGRHDYLLGNSARVAVTVTSV